MNKQILIGILFLSTILLLSNLSLADTAEIEDTVIDYISYREVFVDDPGVIYKIKISNTGTREKDYTVVPDAELIRSIGTYRIDPSEKITLAPEERKTLYFYLSIEKELTGRMEIPVEVRSGLAETTLELVARPIGPFKEQRQGSPVIVTIFKIILIILLVIIIIIALIFSFRKARKKEGDEEELEPDFDEDVETYY